MSQAQVNSVHGQYYNGPSSFTRQPRSSYQPQPQNYPHNYLYVPNAGRDRRRFSRRERIICQVYNKTGHTTVQCFYKFNMSYNNPAIIPQLYTNQPNPLPFPITSKQYIWPQT